MMAVFYRFVLAPLGWLLFQIGSWFGDAKWKFLARAKNAQIFEKRRDEKWIQQNKPFWIHAASGEIEYARPVIRELKQAFPHVPVLVTYSSPSAVRILERIPEVDAYGPSPWEFSFTLQKFIRRFQPRALLIARTDAWPIMVSETKKAGVPSLLFSATFAEDSSRLKGISGKLTGWTLTRLSNVQTVSEVDASLAQEIAPLANVAACGDTRFDQVFVRLQSSLLEAFPKSSKKTLIAGSTWEADEDVLLPAFQQVSQSWRLCLAPHEVGQERLKALESRLRQQGHSVQRWSENRPWNEGVLLIDRVGVLAELYPSADLAFVGGSFRKNVHSVMEALAAGSRVLVGPYHLNNREALEFQKVMAAGKPAVVVVSDGASMVKCFIDADMTQGREQIQAAVRSRLGATRFVLNWVSTVSS